jgi:site-specific recombinase XerD
MEPVLGFEPRTDGLQNRCSTTELNWRPDTALPCRFRCSAYAFATKLLTLCNTYATLSRMQTTPTRKAGKEQKTEWPREVQPGRAIVRVYRRRVGDGFGYMVANYADGERRRFDSYSDEAEALAAAETLAKRLDKRDYVAAAMTTTQALEYANSAERLKPFGISVDAATGCVAECLKELGEGASLATFHSAVRFFKARHKEVAPRRVAEVVADFLALKASRKASDRYLQDLRYRLERFATDCNKACCNVSSGDVQDWLDGLGLEPQGYKNYRTVLHGLFQFAVARGFAHDNPVAAVEKIKVRNGDIEIFTVAEVTRLLEAARANYPNFLPLLAVGAFAGLRSAELERLEWSDIDLAGRMITVGASKSKTASRRIVPMAENLAQWLAPYASRQGAVWTDNHEHYYETQLAVAAASAVEADEAKGIAAQKPVAWKQNGLRHSYASYRFAQTADAGRVAGELGNSAAVVHRHYRELVKPEVAQRWFSVKPQGQPGNVLAFSTAAAVATV